MARSQRPRKAYKPRLAGRPVLDRMRAQLILPAYVALETFRSGTDPDAIVSARHSLAACLDYMGVACRLAGRPREALQAIDAGMVALVDMIHRARRVGTLRPTGAELTALREAVSTCDEQLPLLRTDQIQAAVLNVDAKLFGGEVANHLRIDQKVQLEEAK